MTQIKYYSKHTTKRLYTAVILTGALALGLFLSAVKPHSIADFLATKNIINVANADTPIVDDGGPDADCGNADPSDSQCGGCDSGDGDK